MTLRSNYIVLGRDTPIQLYCVKTWHSDPIIPCWNVTLWFNYTLSECDTPIQLYRVSRWHSNLIIPCENVTLRSNYIINLSVIITTSQFIFYNFIKTLHYLRHNFDKEGSNYKFHSLRILEQSQPTQSRYSITQSSTYKTSQ